MLPGYCAARWVKEAGIPTVGVMHTDDPPTVNGFGDLFVGGNEEWRVSAYVCVSDYLASLFAARNVAKIPAARIRYGLPMPKAWATPPSGELRLVYAGRLANEQKRITDTVRGLCTTIRSIPGVSCDIYGYGPERLAVQEILAKEGSGLPISYRGVLGPAEMLRRLLDYHAFVLLSDYEGQPIALMEAMASGLVPICTRIRSGVPEIVIEGETGIYVDDRGPSLVAAVSRLKNDLELWRRISKAAREKVLADFSLDVTVDAWVRFLTEMAQKKVKRPFQIPAQIELPPRHKDIPRNVDDRAPGILGQIYRKARFIGGRWKQKLLTPSAR
jgi:glycosyltransferase involved in cell wall biosynthesis